MAGLRLRLRDTDGERDLHLEGGEVVAGRDGDCGLHLLDPLVSRRHGRFTPGAGGWSYTDLHSRNGSRINGDTLPTGQPITLYDGDVLQIAGVTLTVLDAGAAPATNPLPADETLPPTPRRERTPDPAPEPAPSPAPPVPSSDLQTGILRIGRAIDNDLVIEDPYVSSYHLEAWRAEGGLGVRDLNARNGTFVDGRRITETIVAPDPLLQLGVNAMVSAADLLARIEAAPAPSFYVQRRHELAYRLVGRDLGRVVGKEQKVILRDIDISVRSGQFVAIVGAAGAGKSTLMKVLNGYTPPDQGVRAAAFDVDEGHEIGYVPQDDIIHRELPLRDTLVLSATLRYPAGTPQATIEGRVDEVLRELGLTEHGKTLVGRLSGGQRKRASVALELLRKPRLILLDEPNSGLDPANDRRMIGLLRALADSGIAVVLITHATANITACDTVAFLAPGGYLVFWGSPAEAMTHFKAERFEDVYDRIEQEDTPAIWRQRFVESPAYQRLTEDVERGLREIAAQPEPAPVAPATPPAETLKWQLRGLATRYARTMLGDRRNLALLLGQVPAILILAKLLFSDRRLLVWAAGDSALGAARQAPLGNPAKGLQLLFILAVALVFFGTINAAREICKELPIWERERHVGVRPLAYVLSKVVVLAGLCFVQTLILVLGVALFWKTPGGALVGMVIVGLLAALSGVTVGLLISALMPTPDRAMTIVPVPMIAQIMFGGGIISLADMGKAGTFISPLIATRWAYEAFGRLTNRDAYLSRTIGATVGGSVQRAPNPLVEQFSGTWLLPALALIVLTAGFGALTAWLVMRGASRREPVRRRPVTIPAPATPAR